MSYHEFKYAFVHPFGPHGDEAPEEILKRKQIEIDANGWTLWSFRHRPMLKKSLASIQIENMEDVYVFCTSSGAAKDPAKNKNNETMNCTHYRMAGKGDWKDMPECIICSQPFEIGSVKRKRNASAFVVRSIIYPDFAPTFEWMDSKGDWRQSKENGDRKLPTRGEFLIRRKKNAVLLGNIRVILELKYPYVADLKVKCS